MKNEFLQNFLQDLKVELMEEFDRNFERKAFFDQKWPGTKFNNPRGSVMMRSGALRKSLRGTVQGNSIRFYSSLAYAAIHNDGGQITVTDKMKKYFWAMYIKATGAIRYNVKTRSAVYDARGQRLSKEAAFWKAMALKKVGSKITIEKRQFIGPHREVYQIVERLLNSNMKEFEQSITKFLKK
ncbi:MAG: hypothetical protein WCL00_00220 [Bacteroidota bacterium]